MPRVKLRSALVSSIITSQLIKVYYIRVLCGSEIGLTKLIFSNSLLVNKMGKSVQNVSWSHFCPFHYTKISPRARLSSPRTGSSYARSNKCHVGKFCISRQRRNATGYSDCYLTMPFLTERFQPLWSCQLAPVFKLWGASI